MKHLMQYTRQLHQRRINAFFFADQPKTEYTQLPLEHVAPPQDRARSLRDMFADLEYDNDDERS